MVNLVWNLLKEFEANFRNTMNCEFIQEAGRKAKEYTVGFCLELGKQANPRIAQIDQDNQMLSKEIV